MRTLVLSLILAGAAATPGDAAWPVNRPAAEPSYVVTVQSSDAERFNRIEAQMRTLTGQVEELQFQVRQLLDQLQRMQADSDFRFGELEGGAGSQSIAPAPQAAAPLPTPPASAQQIGNAGTLAPATSGATVGGASQPLDLSALARGNEAGSPPQLPAPQETVAVAPAAGGGLTGDPVRDYQRGYDLLLTGNYPGAETAFREFLAAFPADARAPDAQFWIGESYFARGLYREAADEFLAGFNSYPASAKGPDTLLKLGLSLAGLGEREAACSTYATVLKRYPDASNALRQRVLSEQAVAAC